MLTINTKFGSHTMAQTYDQFVMMLDELNLAADWITFENGDDESYVVHRADITSIHFAKDVDETVLNQTELSFNA